MFLPLFLTFIFLESELNLELPPSSERETFLSSDSSRPPAGPLDPKWKGEAEAASGLEGEAASEVDWLPLEAEGEAGEAE